MGKKKIDTSGYVEYKQKLSEAVGATPFIFAFTMESLESQLTEKGIKYENVEDVVVNMGSGIHILRNDLEQYLIDSETRQNEFEELMKNKKFAIGAFYCELKNHEYGWTLENEEALEAFGFTLQQVHSDEHLAMCLEAAEKAIKKEEGIAY